MPPLIMAGGENQLIAGIWPDLGRDRRTGQGIESSHAPGIAVVDVRDEAHHLVVAGDVAVAGRFGVDGPLDGGELPSATRPGSRNATAKFIVS